MGNTTASTETVVSKSDRLQESRQAINVSLALLILFGFMFALSMVALFIGEHSYVFSEPILIVIRIVQFLSFIWGIFYFVNKVISHFELLAEPNDSTE